VDGVIEGSVLRLRQSGTLDANDDVHEVTDIGLNGPVGQAYAALRRATGKSCQALFRRKAPWSTGARTRRISPPWPGKGFSF